MQINPNSSLSPKIKPTFDPEVIRKSDQNSISYTEVENILEMALSAPSGDNSQPWRFTWNDNTVAVFYEVKLGAHALNNANHATWLMLGCLLEAISISASGYKIKVSASMNFESWQTYPVAVLRFHREPLVTDPLVSEMLPRWTSREEFLNDPLPDWLVEQMKNEARKFPTCEFSFQAGPPNEIYNFLQFCDEFMWKNTTIAKDFLDWVHLTKRESKQRADGMPWGSLGLRKSDLFPLRVFRALPFLISIFWNFGFRQKVIQNTKKLLRSNAGTYAFAIHDPTPQSIEQVGRLAFRIWLLLNSEGYAVQPISMPVLTAFDMATGNPPPNTKSEFIEKFAAGYQQVKKYFNFKTEQLPIWMFRTGTLKNSQVVPPRSPRVQIQDRLKVYTRSLINF